MLSAIEDSVSLLSTPRLIYPSQNKSFTIETTTPEFKWTKVDNANGYTIYIYNKKKIDADSVFISSFYGSISKPEHKLFNGILENSQKYLLLIRAFNKSGWSAYSDSILFTVKLPIPEKTNKQTLLPPPTIISRNNLVVDSSKNIDKKYGLVWNRKNKEEEYQLIIDGINSSLIFGEEYINVVNEILADTIYFIPQRKLEKYNKFRWKLRSRKNGEWSRFTSYYYFSLEKEKKKIINESLEPEDILLKARYSNLVDQVIIAKYFNNKVYLPILEILSILQNNHSVDLKKKLVSGTRFDELGTNYRVDILNKKIELNDGIIDLSEEDYFDDNLDFYFSKEVIEKIINIKLDLSMKDLTVKFLPYFRLPILDRLINKQKVKLYKEKSISNSNIKYGRTWNYLEGGFFDYLLSSNIIKNQKPYYSAQFGMGGELLGGDIQINNQSSFFNNRFSTNQFTYRWRYAFLNNKFISNISLGNNNALGLQSYDYRGVKISNEPIEARRLYGKYKIEEITNPFWRIEVYQNNQLIDIINADKDGKYSFSIPFTYGTTLIELQLYGRNGEHKVERKMYQIPLNLLPKNKIDYTINLGKLVNRNEGILQGFGAYGINNWLTTKIGTDIFLNQFNKSSIYNVTTMRLLEGYLLDLTIAPNAYQEISINSLFSNLASFNFGTRFFQHNSNFNPTKIKNEINGSFFMPLTIGDNQLSLFMRAKRTSFDNSKRDDLSVRTFYNINNFSPSLEFEHSNFFGVTNNFKSSYLSFRLNYSFGYYSKYFTGNILDSRIKYNILQKKTESFYVSFSTTLYQNYRIQLSHTINFNANYSDTQLRIVFDLPYLRSNTNVSKSSFSQSIFGSINYNNNDNDFEFYNRGMVGRSAAAIKFYLDENFNDSYEKGETIIPDMDVSINSVGNKVYTRNNRIYINDLQQYSLYNVRLIDRKNKNPMWFPKQKEFSFISDPNQFKEIDIPFYEAGEISGIVIQKIEDNNLPISGVTINFENTITKKIIKLKTMSDGSFYKYGIIPGEYKIEVKREQLEKLKLKQEVENLTVKIYPISNYNSGKELEIKLRNDK